MTGWLSKRRMTVQGLADEASDLAYMDEDVSELAGWSQSHAKEMAFQQKKALKGTIEAFNYGILLDHEVEDSLIEAAEGAALKNAKNDQEKVKDRKRRIVAETRMHLTMDWNGVSNLKVWVQSSVRDQTDP